MVTVATFEITCESCPDDVVVPNARQFVKDSYPGEWQITCARCNGPLAIRLIATKLVGTITDGAPIVKECTVCHHRSFAFALEATLEVCDVCDNVTEHRPLA